MSEGAGGSAPERGYPAAAGRADGGGSLGVPVTPPGMSQSETRDAFTPGLFPSDFPCPDGANPAFLCDRVTVMCPVLVPKGMLPEIGIMWLLDPKGSVEGFRHRRRVLEGSWETRATVEVSSSPRFDADLSLTAYNSGREVLWLRIDGNPVKWRQGFNVFGSSDVLGLAREFCVELIGLVGLDGIGCDVWFERGYFNRIDATMNFDLGSHKEASSLVRQLSRMASISHRRSSSFDSSILFAGRRSSLSVYHKGPELQAHPGFREIPGLQAVCDRIVRFEVVYRSEKLDEIGLRRVDSWLKRPCVDSLFSIWWSMVSRLRFPVMCDVDLSGLSAPARRLYACWNSGLDVMSVVSRATAYRYRNAILKAGGPDILLLRPSGDVVEFRRVLRPSIASVPADIAALVYLPRAA